MNTPRAPRRELIERLHGIPVSDPFRSLEDAAAPATIAWVDAENALTRRLLDGADRDALVERLQRLLRVETRAGHGAGKPIAKQIDEQGDMYAFLSRYVTRTSARAQQRHADAEQPQTT